MESLNFIEWLSTIWSIGLSVWEYELYSIDGQPLTVKKVIIAIILFILGYFISRFFTHILRTRLLNRFRMSEGVLGALESLLFYLLVLFFALFALKLAHVPLTVFTVLGGAAAIGIGFGSQNLMNNFISGLIILIEQPIRAGDLIEVDELTGRVLNIGLRSTTVRTSKNIDIIIPNSSFLEKNVVNWTLGDPTVRIGIQIGVAYGSDVVKVKELLLQAVTDNKKVLKSKEPFVWFTDFGDNALIFQVHFWAIIRKLSEKHTIESDIRFHIDELFREASLVIAFPQRDVHLHPTKPLEVKMV